jgi:DNA-binding MarR family transcriptional regulator
MTEELDILRIVAGNPSISQRMIAKQTGISLGQVNFLIKKCAKKGLIKIEGQTSKSIRYNITPRGIAEKAALTLRYIKVSYGAVIILTDKIRELAKEFELAGKKIYVFGPQDEMMGICKLALGDRAIYLYNSTELNEAKSINNFDNAILLHWEDESPKIFEIDQSKAVNILL